MITNTAGVSFTNSAPISDDLDLIGQMTVSAGITLMIVDTRSVNRRSI